MTWELANEDTQKECTVTGTGTGAGTGAGAGAGGTGRVRGAGGRLWRCASFEFCGYRYRFSIRYGLTSFRSGWRLLSPVLRRASGSVLFCS